MSRFLSFFLKYGFSIFSVLLAILSFFRSSRKGKANRLSEILAKVPDYVAKAELLFGSGNGVGKRDYVLTVCKLACRIAHCIFDESKFSEAIEKVLACPQSKSELSK